MLEVNLSPKQPGPLNIDPDGMQFIEAGPGQWRITLRTPQWRPPTDVFETDDEFVIRVEIAGMREEDFNIEMDERILSIRGVRSDNTARRAYHQMEIRFGEFSLALELPGQIVAEKIKAVYDNGFLVIVLPKARPRSVHIEDQNR